MRVLGWTIIMAALTASVHAQPLTDRLGAIAAPLSMTNTGKAHITGESLSLKALKGSDMFTPAKGKANLSAPRVTFPVEGDFIFSARLDAPFAAKYDGAALVVWSDETHWGKFLFERINERENVISSTFVMPVGDNSYHVRTDSDDRDVWLKIVRSGNSYMLYMSQDGKDWQILRDLAFTATGPVQIGFQSQSPLGESFEARFSDIRLESKTLTNYWQGE